MSIWTTWGSCQNADWDSGGWECGLRSAFLRNSQWGGYPWSSNQMLRSKDLKSIKIKLGNGIYKNSTAVPVSLWWGSLIIANSVSEYWRAQIISLIITTVLPVKYDFHFTDNKTEIQRNPSNACKVMQLHMLFSPIQVYMPVCVSINQGRQKIKTVDMIVECWNEVWFLFCLRVPICKMKVLPWPSLRPLPSLTPTWFPCLPHILTVGR